MRFETLRAKGVGPFKDEIAVNLGAIDGRIVAITGGNGQGKSTLLELLAGAMYRQCPTRGALASLATARDSFVEVEVVNGARHTLRHVVDAVSGKGEAVVTDHAGKPLVASAKLREFDGWVAKHLPSPEVLYASTFAAQGSGGFLELKPGDRKAVLLRVLGIERLEALAEKARERARAAKAALAIVDARLKDEEARASDPVEVAAQIDGLIEQKNELERLLAGAQAELEQLIAAEEAAKAAALEIQSKLRQRDELGRRLTDTHAKRADLEKRLVNNLNLVEQAAEIRHGQKTVAELDEQIAALKAEHAAAVADEAALEREIRIARDNYRPDAPAWTMLCDRIERAQRLLAERESVEADAAAAPALRAATVELEVALAEAEHAVKEASQFALNAATIRIVAMRGCLASIAAEKESDPAAAAREALATDHENATRAKSAPKALSSLEKKVAEAKRALDTKRRELADTERRAARLGEITAAADRLVEDEAEHARLKIELTAARRGLDEVADRIEATAKRVKELAASHEGLVRQRRALDPILKLVERLTQAEARIAELQPQFDAATAEAEEIKAQIEMLGGVGQAPALPDVAGGRARAERIDREIRSVESALAVKQAQLADAQAAAARLKSMRAERARGDEEIADWTRLADDLGRDGIQALEIDAAGPELTELVNDLLRSCVGPRWTVTIEASRVSSDGKKTLEGCEVRVLDVERGRDGTAESLSGGERVIVGEAVSLALSMLACRRSGVQGPTLVRDESGAALDPGNARAYVAMLRRAADVIGASMVLLVSHSVEVQELADARIEIRDGKVSVAA